MEKLIIAIKWLFSIFNKEQPTERPQEVIKEVEMANKTFKRGERVQLTKNFNLRELECKCGSCPETIVNIKHINKLQRLRDALGKPIKITSAYRCPEHNSKVGGAPRSQHLKGNATDIQVQGYNPLELSKLTTHFDGVGLYNTFLHLDSRGYMARWNLSKYK